MIYHYFELSKQAVAQYQRRHGFKQAYQEDVIERAQEKRESHPRMGVRVLYDELQPEHLGRAAFEELLFNNGFRLKKLKSFFKTTYSSWTIYENLIAGQTLTDVNQVWVSDITYYFIGREVNYITTIMDLYSRKIIGYSGSSGMSAQESSIKALNMALRLRKGADLTGLKHHSDRGTQYRCKAYVDLLKNNKIQISMCKSVYDNSHMERLNGTLKNDYLIPLGVDTKEHFKSILPVIINRYNDDRPHSSLNKMKPTRFEAYIKNIPRRKRPVTKIKNESITIYTN